MCYKRLFTQWVRADIPDLDLYVMSFQKVVTFEPKTAYFKKDHSISPIELRAATIPHRGYNWNKDSREKLNIRGLLRFKCCIHR